MADRQYLECLDPEIIVPISRQTTEVFKTGTWTSVRPRFGEKISPCRAACPAGNNIAAALHAAAEQDFDAALAAFLEESPLPGVCGRVCYHPCQLACNRVDLDGAVHVRAIERAAADKGTAEPKILSQTGQGKPVAIVGAGPAGLSCAYHLARMGHPIKLLEAAQQAGGLLAAGIPGFRLPAPAFNRDLERILTMTVSLQTGLEVDEKMLAQLTREHEAVFLAPGADTHLPLGVADENLEGVVPGLSFLRNKTMQDHARGAAVVVIGGGNTAIDAARTALRAGAGNVRILYRRSQDQMPAFSDEIAEAVAEGVNIDVLTAPVAFLGKNGSLEAVRLIKMKLGTNGSDGRPRPIPREGSESDLACDLAIVATGQGPKQESYLRELRWQDGRIWVDGWNQTSQKGLFAGGDLTPARASVVDAIATGKRAALGIHLSVAGHLNDDATAAVTLGGGPAFSLTACFEPREGWDPEKIACPDLLTLGFAPTTTPMELPEVDPKTRVDTGEEVAQSLSSLDAVKEAKRCLRCGTCVGCDSCLTFCPEGVVVPPEEPGGQYTVRDDYCKGCSICASVCTRGVMEPGGEQ